MKKISIFILIFSFVFVSELYSQKSTATVNGIVKDAVNKEPLIGAYVFIENTSFGAVTDIDGKFAILNIPSGDYKIKVSYIGYDDQVLDIHLNESEKKELKIFLDYSGVQLGAVKITAQAKGQISAINNQLNSKSIKNVVSAERIQELPDANAAETIGRLPGVSVLRTGGEGSKVVIRGLSPKYNKIMIEGVSLASSDNDRSSDISMVSPYSLDGIEVIKAITADKDADFIGGSVNFKLRSAEKGFHYGLVAQTGYNDLKNTLQDYMIVGSISNRFFKDKLGIYLQGNIEKRNRSSNDLSASYELKNPQIDVNNTVYTKTLQLTDAIRYKYRKGFTFVADYKLEKGKIHFKNFFNNGLTTVNRYNEFYDVPNRSHKYETRDEEYNVNNMSNVLDYEQRFGDFLINFHISNSSTANDNPTNLSFLFEQRNAIKSEVLDTNIAPYDLVDYTLINDSTTYFQTLYEGSSKTNENQQEVKLDFKYDFSISKTINGNIKIGGKYRQKYRDFDKSVYTGNFLLNSGQGVKDAILKAFPEMQNITSLGSSRMPYVLFWDPDFDHKNFMDGVYKMGAVTDIDLMHQVLNVIKQVENPSLETYTFHDYYSKREDYSGNEYLQAAYAMSEINIGTQIKFIPGLRYENNKTEYTGARGDASLAFPNQHYVYKDTTVERNNSFLLPMIHLKYSPTDWMNIRLAYTQTLSRPNYSYIMPRIDLLSQAVIWNNAHLEPEFSTNYDAYISFHQNKLGLLTIGGFAKKIENMIFWLGRRVIIDPAVYDLPPEVKNRDIYTQANNQYDAKLYGVEFDWQTNFWYLNGAWKGLVLNVNYTHIYSQAKYPRTIVEKEFDQTTFKYIYTNIDTFIVDQMQQQPDDIINLQLGYDYKGFSARASMLYQSRIFQRPDFWPELTNYSDEYLRFDVSVKQNLPWYNLQVFANFNNISGAKDRDLVKGSKWDARIQHYGTTIDLGLRMKL